jgi:hypothetical protein
MKEWKIVDQATLGERPIDESIKSVLNGLSIEEQTKYYRTITYSSYIELEKSSDVDALIVQDGIIVGVMMIDCANYPTPCYAGETICTWDAEDNNGAGYKTRTEYTQLVFLPSEEQ